MIVSHVLQKLPCMQDHVKNFTNGAAPTIGSGNVINFISDFFNRIRRRGTEAHRVQQRQIKFIITDEKTLAAVKFVSRPKILKYQYLIAGILEDIGDTKFTRSDMYYFRLSSRNDGELQSFFERAGNSKPVMGIETFILDAVHIVNDSAVRQYSIDIQHDQLDAAELLLQ